MTAAESLPLFTILFEWFVKFTFHHVRLIRKWKRVHITPSHSNDKWQSVILMNTSGLNNCHWFVVIYDKKWNGKVWRSYFGATRGIQMHMLLNKSQFNRQYDNSFEFVIICRYLNVAPNMYSDAWRGRGYWFALSYKNIWYSLHA